MSARKGFTLVEVTIAASVLAIIVAAALGVVNTASEHVADATVRSDLQARGHDAAIVMQRELRVATRASLLMDSAVGSLFKRVNFRQVVGFDTTAKTTLVDPTTGTHDIRFVVDAGETVDGTDQDGDGLIDEGRLVLFKNGAELRDIAAGVNGSTVTFRLEPGGGSAPSPGDTHVRVSFELQQRGRQVGVREIHVEEFRVGLRN